MKGTASKIETGQFGEFAGAVVSQLWNVVKDMEPEELQSYIENTKALRDNLIKAFEKNGKQLPFNVSGTYPVSVDYNRSVRSIVESGKLGIYNWAIYDIKTERRGKADVKIEIVHFNRFISGEDALKEMEENGYRPAELHELLAFNEKYFAQQRKFPIIALGSLLRDSSDRCSVPFLSRNDFGHELLLNRESGWDGDWRFAVVRK